MEDDGYATLFYGSLDTVRQSLQYSNAGHLPALLLRTAAHDPEWLEAAGTVVGMIPDAMFLTDMRQIFSGSLLVLYTDGITEAENDAGEQFTKARLAAVVRNNSNQAAQGIMKLSAPPFFSLPAQRSNKTT